jgi:hypothetical protein
MAEDQGTNDRPEGGPLEKRVHNLEKDLWGDRDEATLDTPETHGAYQRFIGVKGRLDELTTANDSLKRRLSQLETSSGQIDDVVAGRLQPLRDELQRVKARHKQRKATEHALFVIPLLLAGAFVAWLVAQGWASKPDVSIDFNVGEIVGGLLGGLGVLVAGIAYAANRWGREPESPPERRTDL